ncbi:mechanosensitive ion channel domain-containing protein [Kolteria novifilia]|uniref:mechanosensitive ion channel domain-containing protein n=1 Tax=Kolteria novifilia TaxID=2527975 RepID=UPI003AF354C7
MTHDSIEAAIKEVESSSDLADEEKKQIVGLYKEALAQLEKNDEIRRQIESGRTGVRELPVKLESLRRLSRQDVDVTTPTLSELSANETATQAELLQAQESVDRLAGEPGRLKDRLANIPNELSIARARKKELERQLEVGKGTGKSDSTPRGAAQRALTRARIDGAGLAIAQLQQEIATTKALSTSLPAEQAAARKDVDHLNEQLARIQAEIDKRKLANAQEDLRKAKELEENVKREFPSLLSIPESIVRYAEMLTPPKDYSARVADAGLEASQAAALAVRANDRLAEMKERINQVGLTPAMGIYLREAQLDLPNLRTYHDRIRARQINMQKAEVELIRLQSTRGEVVRMRKGDDNLNSMLPPPQGNKDHDERLAEFRRLLGIQQEYLNRAIEQVSQYLTAMMNLDESERRLIAANQKLANYIDANILWYASAPVISTEDFRASLDALAWIVDAEEWRMRGDELRHDATDHLLLCLIVGSVVVALLILNRWHCESYLALLAERASQYRCVRFLPTAQALGLSMLIALPWPLLLWFVGWRLRAPTDVPMEAVAVAIATSHCALVLFVVLLLNAFLRPHGLVIAHFDWDASVIRRCRYRLLIAAAVGLPLIFLVDLMENVHQVMYRATLGRLAFIGLMGVFAWLAWSLFRPSHGVLRPAEHASKLSKRLSASAFVALFLLPVAMAAISALGYVYTARRIVDELGWTIVLVLVATLLYLLALRWLMLARRRLAFEQARAERLERLEQLKKGESQGELDALTDRDDEEEIPTVTLDAIDTQTRHLFRCLFLIGLGTLIWLSWSSFVPAMDRLNRIEVYPHFLQVIPPNASEGELSITLIEVIWAAVVSVLTVIAARNLPGLLEITILERLALQPGGRYAFSTVTSYVTVFIGASVALSLLGISWSHIQWLVAAFTVGIGVGLQEIFGNLASGLILLFEAPIRIGDVVTVEGVTGTVKRIRVRATTLLNAQRQEVLIPNKQFITSLVTNWTLSNRIVAQEVTVGISYDSDPKRARELLLSICERHPEVLDDPPPVVIFQEFGDSSLNLLLRAFVGEMADRLRIGNELNESILEEFNAAGIDIAFPRQDIMLLPQHGAEIESRP